MTESLNTVNEKINNEEINNELNEKQTFEKDLSELEAVVASLEKNDISLDEMLALFEKGIKLTGSCTTALDAAEQKITVLMKNRENGQIVEQPFAAQAE